MTRTTPRAVDDGRGRHPQRATVKIAETSGQLSQVTLDVAVGQALAVCSARLKTWQATSSTASIRTRGGL